MKTIIIPSGVMKEHAVTIREPGDHCDICAGVCQFPNCERCGGHSEHNAGCDTL